MNEIVLNYIVQAILGGASGYITNDYAINMLFKEYTPLKIGGVIKKTRGEFIDNLSSMVENDIINKNKLQEILSDDNFKIQFEKLAADFYDTCIKDAVGNYTWEKIITDETNNFVHNLITDNSATILELMAKHINVKNFLNENQLNSISEFFYSSMLDLFKKNELIVENLLLSLYDENLSLTLNNILDENTSQLVVSNVTNAISELIINLDDAELKKIVHLTGINKAIQQSGNILLNKKICEIINLNDSVINKIDNKVLAYINSDKGIEFIFMLFTSIFAYGKKVDKSIFELLDNNFEESLKLYIIESIPSVTEKIINWIKENNNAIDRLLIDSIDEVINESDGLKAKLLFTIKNTYLKDLSKKYSIIDKLVDYIESITEPEKLGSYISNKAIELLNDITVGEIVSELENNGLTPHWCTETIVSYLNNNFKGILNTSISYINEIKVSKFIALPSEEVLISFIKNLYSAQQLENFLSKKLSLYLDNILSEEIGNLFDKDKVIELSHNLNKYIIFLMKNNMATIKKWICNQINNIAESLKISLDNTKVSIINQELLKGYDNYISNLKNIKLSTTVNQLNEIDNIAKSSSDYLRSYAIKNTDIILKDSIKVIAADNLNKLNDDELVDLANDFIGRELKPIMFFGGVLGVLAGLLLALYQNKALNPQEISIANMVLYAFVGLTTNVIAINMIFKPYKENKLLSKIPFIKSFSLGYIVKNQKIFAEKTSHFIDNSLLNKKGINNLFEKHEENIKNNFIQTAKDNDYIILKNILYKNQLNIVNKIILFFKNKININSNKISSFLHNKISKIKLFIIMKNGWKQINNSIINFINSTEIIESMLRILNSKNTIKFNFVSKKASEFINTFNKSFIREYVNKNKYNSISNKKISEICSINQLEKWQDFISNKISLLLLSQKSRDEFFHASYLALNSSMNKGRTVEEIFDGKIKKYINSLLPTLTENITKFINKSIQSNKSRLTLILKHEIKNQLGFIEKTMYTLMGGDEIVDSLIEKIANDKAPAYLELKKHEINNIITTAANEKLYKIKSEVLFSVINKFQLKKLVDNFFTVNSFRIENTVKITINNSIKNLENIEINKILNLFYLDHIHNVFDVYEKEIDTIINELSMSIKENENEIINIIMERSAIPCYKIFKDIQHESVEVFVNNLNNELNKNNNLEKYIDKFINYFLEQYGDINIDSIINNTEFLTSLNNLISNFVKSNDFEKTIEVVLTKTIDNMVVNNFSFINSESKDYLFGIFVEASINSLKRNLSDILMAVEFNKIAKEEIEKMEPKKIHEMFNSFGEKYFRSLMIYGLGGFIFGINVYVGVSLTALKVISELTNKDK